jgi:hypothetical protein
LANSADRWKWIGNSVWPAWQKYEKTHKDEINRSMQGYDQDYYPNPSSTLARFLGGLNPRFSRENEGSCICRAENMVPQNIQDY